MLLQCRYHHRSESKSSIFRDGSKICFGAIITSQHILLWCSAYVLASTIYLLVQREITATLLPTASLLLASVSAAISDLATVVDADMSLQSGLSCIYIFGHGVAAILTSRQRYGQLSSRLAALQWTTKALLRLSVTAWLAACALDVTFTVAREPYCFAQGASGEISINTGVACILQRTGVGASLICLLAVVALFVLTQKSTQPFSAHLFGRIKSHDDLLPLTLPYSRSTIYGKPYDYSQMSFKCRSTSSLSSHMLVNPSQQASTTHLLPTCPEKAVLGLGIYAPNSRAAAPSFLTPRPSLSAIRSHTTMRSRPPSSPLPPLPAYFPEKYKQKNTRTKATRPLRPPPHRRLPTNNLLRTASTRTVRIVPPSPALSAKNLAAFNRKTSAESLSSVYSRSISGESRSSSASTSYASQPGLSLGGSSSSSGRTHSTDSMVTTVKSPLGVMRRADEPEVVIKHDYHNSQSSDGTAGMETDIDDAKALQAKLPGVTGLHKHHHSGVSIWDVGRPSPLSYCQRAVIMDDQGNMKRLEFTPLMVQKTRAAGGRNIHSIA